MGGVILPAPTVRCRSEESVSFAPPAAEWTELGRCTLFVLYEARISLRSAMFALETNGCRSLCGPISGACPARMRVRRRDSGIDGTIRVLETACRRQASQETAR